jgi:hypothetical protein
MCCSLSFGADETIVNTSKERTAMKKLMTLMLGLAFLTGTVAIAQEKDETKKETKKKKSSKKKSEKAPEEKK